MGVGKKKKGHGKGNDYSTKNKSTKSTNPNKMQGNVFKINRHFLNMLKQNESTTSFK